MMGLSPSVVDDKSDIFIKQSKYCPNNSTFTVYYFDVYKFNVLKDSKLYIYVDTLVVVLYLLLV